MKQTERYGLLDHIKWIDEILYEASWFVEVLDRRRRCCLILQGACLGRTLSFHCHWWQRSLFASLLPFLHFFVDVFFSVVCVCVFVPLSVLAVSAFSLSVLCLCPSCLVGSGLVCLSPSLSVCLSLSLSLSRFPALPSPPFLSLSVLGPLPELLSDVQRLPTCCEIVRTVPTISSHPTAQIVNCYTRSGVDTARLTLSESRVRVERTLSGPLFS